MKIGIAGLGLIGGSIARAFKFYTDDTVLGFNRTHKVIEDAIAEHAIDGELTDENIGDCDYIIVGFYPETTINYIKDNYHKFKSGCIVMDICGIKKYVCDAINPLAAEKGFTFIGVHPMAGTEKSGFANSKSTMFDGASLVLTPPEGTDEKLVEHISAFWRRIGFARIEVTTPENHDRIIAYTSQLAHVASNAYIKSPTAIEHAGFNGGSYKDLTRVAYLNEGMWTELFLENRDYLLKEVNLLIDNLIQYRDALEQKDAAALKQLLKDGREMKEEANRREFKQ